MPEVGGFCPPCFKARQSASNEYNQDGKCVGTDAEPVLPGWAGTGIPVGESTMNRHPTIRNGNELENQRSGNDANTTTKGPVDHEQKTGAMEDGQDGSVEE